MALANQRQPKPGLQVGGQSPQDFGQHGWLGNELASAGGGFVDGLTWGLSDRAYAGLGALVDATRGASLADAYNKRMAYERARDQFYARNFGGARMAGEIGAAFVPVPGVGLVGALANNIGKTAKFANFGKVLKQANIVRERVKQVTPMIGRERAFISGLGAAGGLGGQAYSDAATGHLGSLGDYAASMVGGAAQGGMALRMKPKWAGAGGGAVTSALQDIFNGQPISITKAAEDASIGHLTGAAGDILGRTRFHYRGTSPVPVTVKAGRGVSTAPGSRISNQEKALMGEKLSLMRTWVRGDRTVSTDKKALPLKGGGYTIPDQRTALGRYIESKAGNWARLTKRQIQALAELGSQVRVDHFLPKDLGSLFGFMASQGGYQLRDQRAREQEDLLRRR